MKPARETVCKICEILHSNQIAHDCYQMWHESVSDIAKNEITDEYHRQIGLALLPPLGISFIK